jgi:hypothetical protein
MLTSLQGSLGFSGPKKDPSWLQALIMFFTASKWSHSFVVTFPVKDEEMVMEAQMAVCTTPLSRYRNNSNCSYEIYRLTEASSDSIDAGLMMGYHDLSGDQYGFFQLPCFVVKWVYEKLHIPMVHLPGWVRNGIICSEWSYKYTMIATDLVKNFLGIYDPDLVSPEDIYKVVKAHPELFQLAEAQ